MSKADAEVASLEPCPEKRFDTPLFQAGQSEMERLVGVTHAKDLYFGIVTSISELSCLEHVEGGLSLDFSGHDFESLRRLRWVEGTLSLSGPLISDLTSLTGLEHVGSLRLSFLPQITSLEGIGGIAQGYDLHLGHLQIEDLRGLDGFDSGGITLVDLPALSSFRGLEALGSLDYLNVSNVPRLETLSSFPRVPIERFIDLRENSSLRDLHGLDHLVRLRSLSVTKNDALPSLEGLNGIEAIGEWITISNNNELTSLKGLGALHTIGDELWIHGNPITSLEGLSNLQTVGGKLKIHESRKLESVDHLRPDLGGSLQTVHSFIIYDNPALPTCNVQALIDSTADMESVSVSGNLADECGD
ncbi:MAG: hypothetical protein V3V08_17300 [Nannocystaceae bacterium]